MQLRTRSVLIGMGASAAIVALISLGGCPSRPHGPEATTGTAVGAPPPAPGSLQPRHEGRPYDVEPRESLLTILAFRGGALAKAGHNHVIASHDMSGTLYVPDDQSHSTFEVRVPVDQLTIDEPELRAKEGPDFPTEVPDSAKEGTRRNMLSEALLNGAQYPDITLVSQHIETPAAPGSAVRADVQVTIRGQAHTLSVPVTYSFADSRLIVSGELPIKQTDLGLTPFSAMLGALQVQDELRVRFRIVARQAQTRGPRA
jgi:polyisoprenoid-binding protein YceI